MIAFNELRGVRFWDIFGYWILDVGTERERERERCPQFSTIDEVFGMFGYRIYLDSACWTERIRPEDMSMIYLVVTSIVLRISVCTCNTPNTLYSVDRFLVVFLSTLLTPLTTESTH